MLTGGILRPALVVSYFEGRGERLTTYDERVHHVYAGIGFE